MGEKPVAVVTGGNRGMGYATCRALGERDFRVVLCSRDPLNGENASKELRDLGLDVVATKLDVANLTNIELLANSLRNEYGRIDVLVNNAGILEDGSGESDSVFDADYAAIEESFRVNTIAPLALSNAVLPMMRAHDYGRIVNVSSGMGQLEDMGGRHPAYRLSKTALNAVTRILAAELDGANIKVNALCPGWVRTDMGGANADRSIEEGIDTTVWLATLPDDGPSGGLFRDREPISW